VFVAAAAVVLLATAAGPVAAQLPNFSNVTTNAQTEFAPLVTLARVIILVMCVGFAVWKGYKAANGENGAWFQAIALLLVAGFAATPSTYVNLLGLTDVATQMAAWGL
jgi:ABC-type multidrug transport system permease subunit